jgi:hypothetical protein
MNYESLTQHVLAKLLALEEAVATLKVGADAIERGIEDRRARLWGNVRRADDNPRSLQAELEKLLADQKVMQQRVQAEQAVLSACKAWVDRLPAGTQLEPIAVTADGHDLAGIRSRIKAANAELEALKRAPAPSSDIEARVRDYVRGLAPKVRGIGVGERLSILWPGAQSSSGSGYISEHTCDPLALLAALFPTACSVWSWPRSSAWRMTRCRWPSARRALPRWSASWTSCTGSRRRWSPPRSRPVSPSTARHRHRQQRCLASGFRTELPAPLDGRALRATCSPGAAPAHRGGHCRRHRCASPTGMPAMGRAGC